MSKVIAQQVEPDLTLDQVLAVVLLVSSTSQVVSPTSAQILLQMRLPYPRRYGC